MTDAQLIRVKRITVKKLFGIYDHTIELKLEDRVTIIHGPNGVGKTMMLKLMAALFSGRLHEFGRIPLQQFKVELTNGTSIAITATGTPKRDHSKSSAAQPLLQLIVTHEDGKPQKANLDLKLREGIDWGRRLQLELPWLERIDEDRWLDGRSGQIITTLQALTTFADVMPPSLRSRLGMTEEPEWFAPIRSQVNVHIIETQRLLRLAPTDTIHARRLGSSMVPTVKDYAQDLRKKVTETLARYASESQSLDQSFPQRLLNATITPLGIDDLKSRMAELDDKRAKLKLIGLLDENASYPFDTASLDNLDSTKSGVMTLYVHDTAQKLGVLDDLARRVELLRENVNGKFKHKSLKFDRDRGFTSIGEDGNPLDLDALSSGEQHELVLLYDLLFRVQPNTLVLIDEPELSLHVLWQKRFLPDLLEIVETANFDALVATHSPFIVGDRSDLMIALDAEAE